MSKKIPSSRPKATHAEIMQLVRNNLDDFLIEDEKLLIVGIRGYYKNTFGKPFENDRNFYDDAMFIVTADKLAAFNANVDPSRYRKGIATLKAGLYSLVKWRHRGKYAALQIAEDVVIRDHTPGESRGRHGINFHYGGDSDTWSKGCQTFPQSQYWQFQGRVYELMDRFKLKQVKYLLIEE
jgi:lysozyme